MTSPASMMPRRRSAPLTRTPFDDPLSTISNRASPSAWTSQCSRETELWLIEMVASSARPIVRRSPTRGNSSPGFGPASTTSRFGFSRNVAFVARSAMGITGPVAIVSFEIVGVDGDRAVFGRNGIASVSRLVLQHDAVVADLDEVAVRDPVCRRRAGR